MFSDTLSKRDRHDAGYRYGVFEWRGDGDYAQDESIKNFVRESAALRFADRLNDMRPGEQWVARSLRLISKTTRRKS